jgi:hypothetical protein
MSEEKIKVKRTASKNISYLALIPGITTLLLGLMIVPYAFCDSIVYYDEIGAEVISGLFIAALFAMVSFRPAVVIGLIMSIVMLFKGPNRYFRLLPFAFVVAGLLLYALCSTRLWFTFDML